MVGIDMHCLSLVDRLTSPGKKPESHRRRLFLIARIWNAYRKEGGSVRPFAGSTVRLFVCLAFYWRVMASLLSADNMGVLTAKATVRRYRLDW